MLPLATTAAEEVTRVVISLERNLLTPIPLCFLLGMISARLHGGIKVPKELYASISLERNLLTPIPLCFLLGMISARLHGGIKVPKELYASISIFLLMAIGFVGGHELALEFAEHGLGTIWKPALATLFLGCLTPLACYLVLRRAGGLSVADSAGIAAHYGSTSAVTYAVANSFVEHSHHPADSFLPTLVTILECPGIAVALVLGTWLSAKQRAAQVGSQAADVRIREGRLREALYEVVTGQSIMLMAGLMAIGFIATTFLTPEERRAFDPFYEFFNTKGTIFKGVLCIFLMEMGIVAGGRLGDLRTVGAFLVGFGLLMPLAIGSFAAVVGHLAGLNLGGCTVFAAIVASASYIAAPPAVRLTLPEANPVYSITAALVITFPFNIALGIPLYYEVARIVGAG